MNRVDRDEEVRDQIEPFLDLLSLPRFLPFAATEGWYLSLTDNRIYLALGAEHQRTPISV